MKKIEIIVNDKFFRKVMKQIDKAKLRGYSILEIHSGKGGSNRLSQEFGILSVSKHRYIMLICTSADYSAFKEHVVPQIKDMTSLMFACDIELLQHSMLGDVPDIIC